MNIYKSFLYLIIFIKIIFISSTLILKWIEYKTNHNSQYKPSTSIINTLEFWKERSEFIFIACMSVLLLYLFNPRNYTKGTLDYETRLLLFLYGFIILIKADWKSFFTNVPLLHGLKNKTKTASSTNNSSQPLKQYSSYSNVSLVDNSL